MKKLYILFTAILLSSFSSYAQLGTDVFSVGDDDANNYGGGWGTTNLGTGFSDWTFDNSGGSGFYGSFIGSFSGALDVSSNSFALYANSDASAYSGVATTMPKSLEEGDSFVVSVGINYRDGNKGFDLRNSSNTTIINFNVGSDEYNITGTSGLYGNAYDANTVITFTFTQNATDVSWTAVRSGGLSGTESGTIGSISPGTIENIRFYNASAGSNGDGGAGQRNLFFNSLEFNSLYTITESSTVTSSGDITIPYLDIQSGSTLNIPSTSNVTVSGNLNNDGTLNLTSTSTSYPSVIPNTVSGSGTSTYNRFVNSNANGNDLISSPVASQSWASFLTDNGAALLDDGNVGPTEYAFAPFDKTSGSYENYTDASSETITNGTGYRAATDSGTTLAFSGTFSAGTETVGIMDSGSEFTEWNLIGNPYPSYINVEDFLNNTTNGTLLDETSVGIYGYDGDASNGWTIYNLSNSTATTVIAPGQGFFVAAESAGNIEFTSNMRRTGSTDDFIAGRNAELIYLMLQLSTNTSNYKTDFYFNTNSSLGLDAGYDTKVWGESAPSLAIYSHLVEDNIGSELAIQSLNTSDLSDVTIPLGVNANQGEQLTFSIADMTLPESINVYLDDVVANTSTLLNNSDYVMTPTTVLSGTGRFFLRTSEDALSTIENSFDALNIFALNTSNEIVVSGQLKESTVLSLYDIQGRKVLSTALDNTNLENRINVSSLNSGIYIVNVKNNSQQKSQKLVIN
ncbi:T9SS type A sorting domain-containing protein [Psychroserpens ponticola]|uniref:T9SS type A sorting domain-containing protein n=1 Tax=Psychroserpens ponticola TaxID=2932268 RepID=A0ABY7RVJ1_9FLAO|nr:T9SS type A sorting domain-containing protein [Psychroserpens ponticola]WCO01148.1 T9SS type A sorting domain-containing protein [Psychroserpens ponticola]